MTTLPHLPDLAAGLPDWALPAAGVGAVAVLAVTAWAAGHHTRTRATDSAESVDAANQASAQATLRRWRAAATTLTVIAAAIATATALNGMWHVFGDTLHLDTWARLILVGFLEIPLVTSAIRARVAILEGRTPGGDGVAVWVLAALSAGLSAADATSALARALRLVVPLVAAWMWHQSLAADRRTATAHKDNRADDTGLVGIAWRWTPRRVAVRLGLADPTYRPGGDVDRARRLARLTKARLRLAVLSTQTPRPLAWLTLRPVRRAVAAWRLQRQALGAVEHLRLGADPTITATITTTVAAVVGLADATNPTTLAASPIDPWTARLAVVGSAALPTSAASGHRVHVAIRPAAPRGSGPSASQGSDRSTQQVDPKTPDPPRADPPAETVAASDRRTAEPSARTVDARPTDVVRLHAAVTTGRLPPRPTVDAVRRHLQISPAYARAARAAFLAQPPTGRTHGSDRTAPPALTTTSASSSQETAQREGESNEQPTPDKPGIATEEHLIDYRPEKFQETTTSNGTHAVRLP